MGELNIKKQLCCLICDCDVDVIQSYSIFYTFITNSGILLANSLEKNLSLKDLGSLQIITIMQFLTKYFLFNQI